MLQYAALQLRDKAAFADAALTEKLPPSSRRILDALLEGGALNHAQLAATTGLPSRTIRFAMRSLRERGLVERMPCLRDCRTAYFFLNREKLDPRALAAARTRSLEPEAPSDPTANPPVAPSLIAETPDTPADWLQA